MKTTTTVRPVYAVRIDTRADYDRARREHLAAFAAWEAAGMVDGTAEAREVMAASARLNVARRAMMAR